MTELSTRQNLDVTLGAVAHGGHVVARHEDRVIFVRHGIPGERVRIRLTEAGPDDRFWRADVVEVLQASPDRKDHPWAEADALAAAAARGIAVGGAEFGHIRLERQRALKAQVLAEQLRRLAGVERETAVEQVPGSDAQGLNWRTRVAFAVTEDGRLGMHGHRSDRVLPVASMPLATEAISRLGLFELRYHGMHRVEVAAPADGSTPLVVLAPQPGTTSKALTRVAEQLPQDISVASTDPRTGQLLRWRGRTWVRETVGKYDYRVTGEGFWQIHRQAPATLMDAAMGFLREGDFLPEAGQVADLYAGAGLFTAPLAEAVGPQGRVLSVEGAPGASRDARKNLHGFRQVEVIQGKVERVLRQRPGRLDAIILDPPRAGAAKTVVKQLIASDPRAIVYVSCDPASFARDVGYFDRGGWEIRQLRAFDLYPNTHHLETVALLVPKAN